MTEAPAPAGTEFDGRAWLGIEPKGLRAGRVMTTVYLASGLTLAGNQLYTLGFFWLLPAASVGLINWATATAAIVFYFLDLGIDTSVVIVAKAEPVRLRALALVVGAFRASAALVAFIALAIGAVTHLLDSTQMAALVLVGSAGLARLLQTPFSAALQIRDRQGDVALLNLLGTAIKVIALVLLWLAAAATVTTVLLAGVFGEVAALAAVAWVARTMVPAPGPTIGQGAFAKQVLRYAPAVALSQAALIAQARVDWLLVAALASYSALASYALANKAVELIMLAGSIFGRAALPWFVEGWASRNLGQLVRSLIVGANLTSMTLALAGWPIVRFIFHTKYLEAEHVIPVLAAVGPALVVFQILQFAIMGGKRTLDVLVATGAAFAVQLAVDLLAIRSVGIIGAAYGMCAFAAVGVSVLVLSARRRNLVPKRALTEMVIGSAALPAVLLLPGFVQGLVR